MKYAVLNSGSRHLVVNYDEKAEKVCVIMRKKSGRKRPRLAWLHIKYIKALEDKD